MSASFWFTGDGWLAIGRWLSRGLLALALGSAVSAAAAEANCELSAPPEQSGVAATPGGFLLVYPRNAQLGADYSGCKTLWLVDGAARHRRLATLHFEHGEIVRAVAYDIRREDGRTSGVCEFKPGVSAAPADARCAGVRGEALYALKLPTWPRRCLAEPGHRDCAGDPK